MSVARVVSFDGVDKTRMEELDRMMSEGGPPEGFPPAEIAVLYDEDAQKSLVVFFFENDADYQRGDEILSAMPADETPGSRTSVARYDVRFRMKG